MLPDGINRMVHVYDSGRNNPSQLTPVGHPAWEQRAQKAHQHIRHRHHHHEYRRSPLRVPVRHWLKLCMQVSISLLVLAVLCPSVSFPLKQLNFIRWIFEHVGCILSAYAAYLVGCTSIYLMAAISLER